MKISLSFLQPWRRTIVFSLLGIVGVLFLGGGAFSWYYRDRVVLHTSLGELALGGLSRDQVAARVAEAASAFEGAGIHLSIAGVSQPIRTESIGFALDVTQAVQNAFAAGHTGSAFAQFRDRIRSLWRATHIDAPVLFDQDALASEISDVADITSTARRDVRLQVKGATARLATDTAVGRVINQEEVMRSVVASLRALDTTPLELTLYDDPPRADPLLAQHAVVAAQRMVARPLVLSYEDLQYGSSRERVASWLASEYENDQLVVGFDHGAVSAYVTTIADALNIPPQPAHITTDDGRVTGFTPPKVGRVVQEEKLVQLIEDTLRSRATPKPMTDTILVPLKSTNVALTGLDSSSGITERIGMATTPFTGSPRNRISNIKNGVKFLTGTIVPAGGEFSTLGTLGVIDNTTGYLPELVIKGDRTIPEFGGGLCQVSTTLFRAVMNAGLPVTARRNHSYRVSYYENDGNGRVIGPGLDATIYEPNLDFKFLNDTDHPVLIIGSVAGDKVTFELYGTSDGRTSLVDGPHTLTQTPAGEPVYIDEPTLAVGVKKQVEVPHPGGSAVATYTITYADGTKKAQIFSSWYRPWPAKYLVGTGGVVPSPTPVP